MDEWAGDPLGNLDQDLIGSNQHLKLDSVKAGRQCHSPATKKLHDGLVRISTQTGSCSTVSRYSLSHLLPTENFNWKTQGIEPRTFCVAGVVGTTERHPFASDYFVPQDHPGPLCPSLYFAL